MNFDEYEKADTKHNNTTFFCRANYDYNNMTLNPSFEKWEKSCLCENPLNPDQLYIKCDGCEKWFHPRHCGLTELEASEIEKFFCANCQKKSH